MHEQNIRLSFLWKFSNLYKCLYFIIQRYNVQLCCRWRWYIAPSNTFERARPWRKAFSLGMVHQNSVRKFSSFQLLIRVLEYWFLFGFQKLKWPRLHDSKEPCLLDTKNLSCDISVSFPQNVKSTVCWSKWQCWSNAMQSSWSFSRRWAFALTQTMVPGSSSAQYQVD